jgi:hypothetical protein
VKSKVLRKLISTVLLSAFLVLPITEGLACDDFGVGHTPHSSFWGLGKASSFNYHKDGSLQYSSPHTGCPSNNHDGANHCSACLLHAHVLMNQEVSQIQLCSTSFTDPTVASPLVEPVLVIYEPPKS